MTIMVHHGHSMLCPYKWLYQAFRSEGIFPVRQTISLFISQSAPTTIPLQEL